MEETHFLNLCCPRDLALPDDQGEVESACDVNGNDWIIPENELNEPVDLVYHEVKLFADKNG